MVGLMAIEKGRSCSNAGKLRKFYIARQAGLEDVYRRAVLAAVEEIVEAGRLNAEIMDFGDFKNYVHCYSDETLKPYCSLDWYLKSAMRKDSSGKECLESLSLIDLLENEPWKKKPDGVPHYDIIVVNSPIYEITGNITFSQGITDYLPGNSSGVISTASFDELDRMTKYRFVRLEARHLLGHILGLDDCQNICSMSSVDDNKERSDLVHILWNQKPRKGVVEYCLCDSCETGLQKKFRDPWYKRMF